MVRHGERVDETSESMAWMEQTPRSRLFDPPLTRAGEGQAATAAETLRAHPSKPNFGATIYASPLQRCLRTASVLAEQLGKSVRVVPGLGQCAAVAKRRGVRALDLLPESEMMEICPQMIALEKEAPDTFEEACDWVASERTAGGCGTAADEQSASGRMDVLVVTHREGIRDIAGIHQRLPYCTIARFDESGGNMGNFCSWALVELAGPDGADCVSNRSKLREKQELPTEELKFWC